MPRKYEKVKELLPLVTAMAEEGKTRQQIAEELGLQNEKVARNLLYRAKRKNRNQFQNKEEENRQKLFRSTNMKTSD